MSKKGNGIGKVVAGLGIGAALGILFAPKSGVETRKDIKKKADELTKKIKEVDLEELKDDLIDDFENLKEELATMDADKAKILIHDKGEELQARASELIDMAKEKGTPIVEKTAKDIKKKLSDYLAEASKKLAK